MMTTNIGSDDESEFAQAGRAFLEAGYRFWQLHQQHFGSNAVVWAQGPNGHLAIFTRGEYKAALLESIECKSSAADGESSTNTASGTGCCDCGKPYAECGDCTGQSHQPELFPRVVPQPPYMLPEHMLPE